VLLQHLQYLYNVATVFLGSTVFVTGETYFEGISNSNSNSFSFSYLSPIYHL
jgi:hypothetical protein